MSRAAKLLTKEHRRPKALIPGTDPSEQAVRRAVKSIDAPDNQPLDAGEMAKALADNLDALPDDVRHEVAVELAKARARDMAADVIRHALDEPGAPSLRGIEKAVGIDPSQVSKIAAGALDGGPHLWTLCRIAMALQKRVVISFE